MNRELLNQLPIDERQVAEKLSTASEAMKISPGFQRDLEIKLMEKANSRKSPAQRWFTSFMIPIGWAIAAIGGVLLLSWTIRSLVHNQVAATPIPEASFEDKVRAGTMCVDPLVLAHGFDVFLANPDKTAFVSLDPENTIGELRSFAWSAHGQQLAVVGNHMGNGNIYLPNSSDNSLRPVLLHPELGYLMDVAWSWDGKRLLAWSAQNNQVIFLLNADGTGMTEKRLDLMLSSTPQFTPDGKSIVFQGANTSTSGLFEVGLENSETRLINASVEDSTAFAFSPDGSRLAYMAMDRRNGAAVLMVEDLETRATVALPGSLPIPKGSGSSIPESANLQWSADSTSLVFDFGRGANNRAIYLARLNQAGIVKLVDSAYAPALSADGKCLAYIHNKQVFLLDLTGTVPAPTSVLLADLPAGKAIADYQLDKLQWRP